MKKCNLFIAVLTTVLLGVLLSGCQPEGVYNPKKKLARVYYLDNDGTKQLDYTMVWGRKFLEKIDFAKGETFFFSYENNQITGMISTTGDEIHYQYDGSILTGIEVLHNGYVVSDIDVEHDGKHISKVTIEEKYETGFFGKKIEREALCMSLVLPEATCENIAQKRIEYAKSGQKETKVSTILLEYEGDNISKERWVEDNYTMTYTYNDGLNPFYGLVGLDGDYVGNFGTKNTMVTAYHETPELNFENNYNYVFDGKWPLERTKTRSGHVISTSYYEYE